MSSIAHPLAVAVPVGDSLVPVAVVLLGGGLVGMSIRNMFESIMSEDEADDADAGGNDPSTDGGSGLMAEGSGGEDEGDDLGGLGGLDDDDDLGGFDDGFGEMDDGGGDVDELEHRLDEMEAEVGSLSSTVNTVRNENEQISESVAEVEENVRKLLDIYEMVTRGVNPFADDIDAGMAGGVGDGGFGLFADEDEQTPDEIDEDIAEADAEGFFDEDLVEDDELEADADVGDVLGEGGDDGSDFEDEFDEDFEEFDDDPSDDASGDEDGGGGTSFQDLKEEYESGDADWADGEAEDGDDLDGETEDGDDLDGETDDEDDLTEDDLRAAGAEPSVDEELDDLAEDELFDEVIEDEAESTAEQSSAAGDAGAPAGAAESDADRAGDVASTADTRPDATAEAAPTDTGATAEGEPYLATLPEGFGAELLVVEWLEYLVETAGVRETARALDYYESIDWIAEPVADDLQDHLAGFDGGANGSLSIDDHTRSLQYIGQLDGGGADTVALQRLTHGGGSDGIQR